MGANRPTNRLNYEVDLVFCIDATFSMDPILDKVKANAINFYRDFYTIMQNKGKSVSQLRIKIVAFRDYKADKHKAMMTTNFFVLPNQTAEFEACIKSIEPEGGGDLPEDGLEAIAYAIRSEWCNGPGKKRHVIVVWSDDATHPLGVGPKMELDCYPNGMAQSFDELTRWWGCKQMPGLMDENAKRLLMFTPDKPGWNVIRDNWNNVIHAITDDKDKGLSQVEYAEIMNAICNSI